MRSLSPLGDWEVLMKLPLVVVATIVCGLAICCASSIALPKPELRVTTDDQADTRQAITKLLQAFKKSFRIGPDVKGSVTARVKNATFESALIRVMAAAGVNYEIVDGTYVFSKAEHMNTAKPPDVALPSGETSVSIDLDSADVRVGLQSIFSQCRRKVLIATDVKGLVTLNLRKVSLEAALKIICESVGATWWLEDGIYRISKRG